MPEPTLHLIPLAERARTVANAASEEGVLIEKAQSDPDAFGILYRSNYPAIMRYIQRRVGDEHVAADLVAETFVTAIENLGGYRFRGLPFRSWLYRLATTCIGRWARREGNHPTASLEGLDLAANGACSTSADAAEIARRALLGLPLRYQNTLALHYIEGLSVQDVAKVLGLRPGTIKSRLARGRDQLRLKLTPYAKEFLR